MTKYNQITEDTLRELRNIVGPSFVVTDEEKMMPYAHDEVSEDKYVKMPEVVVRPRTKGEISSIMKLANKEGIPVTPRGAGTGLSAGCVPVFGGIVLSMERFNKVLEVDKENLFIITEPGVTTGEIQKRAEDEGLFYAGDPCSAESSQIGGNVAENAGGNRAIKYGTTSRYVLGLEVVLPNGKIMNLGGKCVKDVAGYDLIRLIVGSEGTLGIVTKIWLKLLPLPKYRADLLVPFKKMQEAIEVVPKIMTMGGIVPTSVEFMDSMTIKAAELYLNQTLPHSDSGAYIIVEVEGSSEAQVEDDYETIGKLCLENGGIEVYVADNLSTQERIWESRKCVAEALRVVSPVYCMEDITVPTSEIPEILKKITNISEKYGVKIPCFGHAGDGNIHATLLRENMDNDTWENIKELALREIYTATCMLGGNISGEHGIGAKRIHFLKEFSDPVALNVMQQIKLAIDPNIILNPGKIFGL